MKFMNTILQKESVFVKGEIIKENEPITLKESE